MTRFAGFIGTGLACVLLASSSFAQTATEIWRTTGFSSPESVEWDAAAGVRYVSNMGADPMAKDGDGYIATLGTDGAIKTDKWVTGLDAPKGMAASGGKLYSADIDQIVEIDIATGAVLNRYPVTGAVLLNDVAAAPDGRIFISDTMTNTVHLLKDGAVTTFASGPMLMGVNGLTVSDGALLAADLGDLSAGFDKIKPGPVVSIDLATAAITPYGAEGPVGILDGIESDGAGGMLVTDYMQGTVLRLLPGGTATVVATLALGSADLEVIVAEKLILVPITPAGEVVGLRLTD